jgi:hypothetical protein
MQKTHIVGEIVASAMPRPRSRRSGATRILTFRAGAVRDGAGAYRAVARHAADLAQLAVGRGLLGATAGEPYHRGRSEWLCDVIIPVA